MTSTKDKIGLNNVTRKIVNGAKKTFDGLVTSFKALPKPMKIFIIVLMIVVVVEIPIFIAVGSNIGNDGSGSTGNRAPVINSFAPISISSMAEGDTVQFSVKTSDLDGDSLSYQWTVNGTAVGGDLSGYTFASDYRFGGRDYMIRVSVSDGTHTVTKEWTVAVPNHLAELGVASPVRGFNMIAVGNVVYFNGDDVAHGEELWRSDGTVNGTYMVKDIYEGGGFSSFPDHFAAVGDTVFFAAAGSGTGAELWKSNGTAAGTVLVRDINEGIPPSMPDFLTTIGDTVYFNAVNNTFGYELWKTDGTINGTVLVKDINPTGDSYPTRLTAVGNTLFFRANNGTTGDEPWKSDGTTNGTVLIKDIETGGGGSNPDYVTVIGTTVFFEAYVNGNGSELFKSNLTAEGTERVKNIRPGSDSAGLYMLTRAGSTLFFRADDGINGSELWRSDGTESGTYIVKNINTTGSSYPYSITAVGNMVFFVANNGINGSELWRSDGTESGTVLVKDINPGKGSSNIHVDDKPYRFAVSGNSIFFEADNSTTGLEPWVSDGTAEGTILLMDIISGISGSEPSQFIALDNWILFSTLDKDGYSSLWNY